MNDGILGPLAFRDRIVGFGGSRGGILGSNNGIWGSNLTDLGPNDGILGPNDGILGPLGFGGRIMGFWGFPGWDLGVK